MTIVACSRCGAPVDDENQFCGKCGSKVSFPTPQFQKLAPHQFFVSEPLPASGPGPHTANQGFAQRFGLDPRIAFLTFVVDMMLFGGDVLSGGALMFFSLFAGAVLGFVTYRAQMKWYGDDQESAKIKGFLVGLLTAIPVPLPAILSIPSGVVGLVHNLRKK